MKRRRRDYANLAAYTATLCFGVFTLYLFLGLWEHGSLLLYEDSLAIRAIETFIAVCFILFGGWGVLQHLHEENEIRKGKKDE